MKQLIRSYTTLMILSLLSTNVFAESSHQFSIYTSASKFDYDDEGEGKQYSLGISAYFEPVKKSSALPYARTAFYSRTGSAYLSASKYKSKNLNRISGGRILDSIDAKHYSAELFLAQKNMPIWAQLSYTYLDKTDYSFNVGDDYQPDTDSVKGINLGVFLSKSLSVYGSFSKQNDDKYGLGIRKLFDLDEVGFLDTSFVYSHIKRKSKAAKIQNNIIRNLNTVSTKEESWYIRASYFPFPQTQLSTSYQLVDFYEEDLKNKYYSVGVSQYLFDDFRIGLSYFKKEENHDYNYGDYTSVALNLGVDF